MRSNDPDPAAMRIRKVSRGVGNPAGVPWSEGIFAGRTDTRKGELVFEADQRTDVPLERWYRRCNNHPYPPVLQSLVTKGH